MNNILTIVSNTDEQHRRSHFTIDTLDGFCYLAEFETQAQLNNFLDTLGVKILQEIERREDDLLGAYARYNLSHKINGNAHFTNLEELPKGAKPIKALSNGSIVTCYYLNDGETVTIFRPNPNNEDIYKPLDIKEHIKHIQTNGLY